MRTLSRAVAGTLIAGGVFAVSANPYSSGAPTGSIAFVRMENDRCAIHSVDADGSNVRRLTRWHGFSDCDTPPVWSPDGARIAYYANGALWVMKADGTKRKNLGPADYPESEGSGPSWSPDGRSLAFTRNPEPSRNASAVYTIHIDGTGRRRLTTERFADEPTWSPGGTLIAYRSERTSFRGEIFVMRTDGTRPRRLTRNDAVEESLAWSPDGRTLSFRTGHEIYATSIKSSEPTLVTTLADLYGGIAWAPDSRRIAFDGEDPTTAHTQIYVTGIGMSGDRPLTSNGWNYSPSWSPDGRRIVVSYFQSLDGPTRGGLKVVTVRSRTSRQISERNDYLPAWQPVP
jgi:Tol biopolymer transport system component